MNKVLVLGGSGLVGKAVIKEMSKDKDYEVYGTYAHNPIPWLQGRELQLDVNDTAGIGSILYGLKPNIVVSCLRGDYDKQLVLHAEVTEYLKDCEGRLYFCSTANVFDNDLSRPHYEGDAPDAATDYGQYKQECEKRLLKILGGNCCIFRLPQIWGTDCPRMTMLQASISRDEEIEVYPGLLYNTNTDVMLARQIHYIIRHGLSGIFHLAAEDIISHKDFYSRLLAGLGHSNARRKENPDEKGYMVLLSNRHDELPPELRISNEDVIRHLSVI